LIEALEHLLHPANALRTLERMTNRAQLVLTWEAARAIARGHRS
jgi:hypothetical protein